MAAPFLLGLALSLYCFMHPSRLLKKPVSFILVSIRGLPYSGEDA
jgi:hypothetical protein